MIITMSPAKLFNLDIELMSMVESMPCYSKQAKELNMLLKQYAVQELADMMNVNPQLAFETYGFIHSFESNKQALYPAACLYNGIAYQALDFASFHEQDMKFAEQHLFILSGLYGILRPLDGIKPYRLEMQTILSNPNGENLYAYWQNLVTNKLSDLLSEQATNVWLNLASKEYGKVIDKKKLPKGTQIINPVFKETKGDAHKQVVVYVKRARGLMARFVVQNKIKNAEDVKAFDLDGYTFSESLSSVKEWVFIR